MDNFDIEIYNMINKIIYEQNIILLKKIAKDFNRDEKILIKNYENKLYK
jgi:hypothetical protein|tara:strand:+ start:283 stop:429 length:147 start_codon:yes stop_codon:yes gene_type:complete